MGISKDKINIIFQHNESLELLSSYVINNNIVEKYIHSFSEIHKFKLKKVGKHFVPSQHASFYSSVKLE